MCPRLSGFYHVKSYPSNGLRFSTKEPEAIFQDLGGIVDGKKLANTVGVQLFDNFTKS